MAGKRPDAEVIVFQGPQSGRVYIGCAGWSIPREHADEFPPAGDTGGLSDAGSSEGRRLTHLERYALRLTCVEINSSFYRPHQPQTYARWTASTPDTFKFSVKLPRQITHVQRLRGVDESVAQFRSEVEALGPKLGPVLVQLPPSLVFEEPAASAFFETLRKRFPFGDSVVCEPRHATWFQPEAEELFQRFRIGRVAADPAVPVADAANPGGWGGMIYYRLHGSPRTYYSAYSDEYLAALTETFRRIQTNTAAPVEVWCIFDNTALGAATPNALRLTERLGYPH